MSAASAAAAAMELMDASNNISSSWNFTTAGKSETVPKKRREHLKLRYVLLLLLLLSSGLNCYLISIMNPPHTEVYEDSGSVSNTLLQNFRNFRNDIGNWENGDLVENKKEKIQITFTNFGWHTANGMNFPRVKATRQLYDAILEHERYNVSAFSDATGEVPYYVFLDVETCGESNWPAMVGHSHPEVFSDTDNGRVMFKTIDWNSIKRVVDKTLSSLAMSHPDSRLIVMNCQGNGQLGRNIFDAPNRDSHVYGKVVVVSLSSNARLVSMHNDFGIPPLPIKPVLLNDLELQQLKSCTEDRKYLFSFQGRNRIPFPEFKQYMSSLHNGKDIYVEFTRKHYIKAEKTNTHVTKQPQNKFDFYNDLLKKSTFVGVPRGDNLFSYRFSEVMSAGAIPVIYADDWLMPYTRDVMNFEEFAVVIAQENVNATKDILMKISPAERCKMQNRALDLYNTYVNDSNGRLRGILAVLDSKSRFGQNVAPH